MSWDIVLFNSREKILSVEELDESQLEGSDNHRSTRGKDFETDYFLDDEPVSNKMLGLYGENGLSEMAALAHKHHWQIFDTGFGQMIDLENPANNGYENFQRYLQQVLKGNK